MNMNININRNININIDFNNNINSNTKGSVFAQEVQPYREMTPISSRLDNKKCYVWRW